MYITVMESDRNNVEINIACFDDWNNAFELYDEAVEDCLKEINFDEHIALEGYKYYICEV